MELGLKGRQAIVTGGSKGIGLAVAKRLVEEGCRVTLVSRSVTDLEAAAHQLGPTAAAFPADLSRSEEVNRLWATAPAPDILVNNAGAIPGGSIGDVDEARWREAWNLKVFGYINLCRHALEAMTTRGSGVIINVIGVGGEKPMPSYIAGAGGNAALMAMTRALGSTSLEKGVRVVGINPGHILTERYETLLRTGAHKNFGDETRWRELIDPLHPPGQPDHIAALAAFLASDLSGNTTGTIFTSDGGASSR